MFDVHWMDIAIHLERVSPYRRRNVRIVMISISKIRKLLIPFSFLAGSIYYPDAP
jgi:hypothetical protein